MACDRSDHLLKHVDHHLKEVVLLYGDVLGHGFLRHGVYFDVALLKIVQGGLNSFRNTGPDLKSSVNWLFKVVLADVVDMHEVTNAIASPPHIK